MKAKWSLYKNFSKEEFDCRHTGRNEMKHPFMAKLQTLRTAYGKRIDISSGYRDRTHPDERKKKRKNGVHPLGIACDIPISRKEAYILLGIAWHLNFTGIGIKQRGKKRFIHLDMLDDRSAQPRPSVWSY